jgi:hypothetical protein
MSGIVVFPDAVDVTRQHLLTRLAEFAVTCPVVREIPVDRPELWVRVLRTGGVVQTIVSDAAQLTVEVWADTVEVAHDTAQIVRGILLDRTRRVWDGVQVYRVAELSGPLDFPDPDARQPRFVWSVVAQMRGVETFPTV